VPASSRRTRARRLVILSIALATSLPPVAGAAVAPETPGNVIEVFPGPNALNGALNRAQAGDTLLIHTGTYREHVTITKNDLTLMVAGDGPVTVDARCHARFTIAVRANGVLIDGLRVTGADEGFGPFPTEVDFTDLLFGTIRNSSIRDTCNAEYGVNVYRGGAIKILNNTTSGLSDAGIYIGGIISTGGDTLDARGNRSFGNTHGVIVEDSAGGIIRVWGNDIHDNTANGIFVMNSDAVRIKDNSVTDDGQSGIELDPSSDGNLVARNTVSGHSFDLSNDGGTGNCWRDNAYGTSRGDISC
jgi:parallel beta-helix repeat protein